MPRAVQSPGLGEDLEKKEPRFCHLGCGPPPPRQVLSPAGRCRSPGPQASQPVPAGNDCKSTLLFELPLGPQHRSPPVGRDGALSRQPPGPGTEPGYYRASGRSLPGGC
ncbi:unnamed protein product [Rangifer tarandus platyrhynchus]|uniref:Uncharacterized protein n=1 Tax=Rangifer tarandus platyrhynchus TaxID=3082113 RepID=A0ABN9A7X1_RANTA|nr:unnamed protein product [Rangifer tarandus platyrhynchus]